MSLLTKALAKCISSSANDGTWRLEFPSKIQPDFLVAVAADINDYSSNSDGSPVAVGFMGANTSEPPKFFLKSEFQLINLRCDTEGQKRFFIFRGHANHESIVNASKPLLGAQFPSICHQALQSLDLAMSASELLVEEQGEGGYHDTTELALRLNHAFLIVQSLFEGYAVNTRVPWNVEWYEFVEAALERLHETGRSLEPDLVYPAFGLPIPAGGGLLISDSPVEAADKIRKAYVDWWANLAETEKSLGFIGNRVSETERETRALLQFDSDAYRAQFRVRGDSPAVLLSAIGSSIRPLQSVAVYPVSDFLSPRSRDRSQGIQDVLLPNDQSALIGTSKKNGLNFLVDLENENGVYRSQSLTVKLGFSDDYDFSVNLDGGVELVTSQKDLYWETSSVEIQADSVHLRGYFLAEDGLVNQLENQPFILVGIGYDLGPEDPLSRLVKPTGSAKILVCNNWTSTDYLLHFDSQKKITDIEFSYFADNHESESSIDSDISALQLLVRSRSATSSGRAMGAHANSAFRAEVVGMAENIEIRNSEGSVVTLFQAPKSGTVHSPILAAILKQQLAESAPSIENSMSIRGVFEDYIASGIENPDWLKANFHFAVANDVPLGDRLGLGSSYPEGVVCSNQVGTGLNSIGFALDTQFLSSHEVAAFQESWKELEVEDSITSQLDNARSWISKTSWKHLGENRQALDNYLTAFNQMVRLAKENFGEQEWFWASYPFSISTWDFQSNVCSAVLLSPLHPIRLAWMASTEHALWSTSFADQLSGVIENWNFPMIGPSFQPGTSMLSVPTDFGKDQQFMGWSTMVLAHSQAQSVTGPERIAGYPAPGSSATGLNASAAKSAIQSFRHVNPQFSSLTIDLAVTSGSKAPRLRELDDAIINFSDSLAKLDNELPGGLHVVDSTLRLGEFPRESVLEAAANSRPRPFTWQRYTPDSTRMNPSCQLRLLQDPGLQVRIEIGENDRSGAAASVPFRRFAAPAISPSSTRGTSATSVNLGSSFGWTEFRDAIETIEGLASGNRILSSLNRPSLADTSADWIVSGEGLLSPSVVASLLSATAGGSQMLWEWKPPYFGRSGKQTTEISRRAFMTIARIPKSFSQTLQSKIAVCGMSESDSRDAAKDMLATLGRRGMGLSALLSLGDTHTSGAIGFYSSYKILESFEANKDLLVVPIDACDGFLHSLSLSNTNPYETEQRADLLAIKLGEGKVTLFPIEIKMYGLTGQPYAKLPDLNSSQLEEARGQAANTTQLLTRVVQAYQKLISSHNNSERDLWLSGFGTLIETARKLSPSDPTTNQRVSNLMASLFRGELEIAVGNPIVNFFVGSISDEGGPHFRVGRSESNLDGFKTDVLIASLESVLDVELRQKTLNSWQGIAFSSPQGLADSSAGNPPSENPEPFENAGPISDLPNKDLQGAATDQNTSDSHADVVGDTATLIPSKAYLGIKPILGTYNTTRTLATWWPGHRGVAPHLGVIGASGMGKTQLMKSVLGQMAEEDQQEWGPPGILILDFKGDFSNKATDPQYDKYRERFNFDLVHANQLFLDYWSITSFRVEQLGEAQAKLSKASSFVGLLQKVFTSGVGPIQIDNLKKSVIEAYQISEQQGRSRPTLEMIRFRYLSLSSGKADLVSTFLSALDEIDLFEKGQKTRKIEEILGRRKNTVVNLSVLKLFSDPRLQKVVAGLILELARDQMYAGSYSASGEFKGNAQRLNQVIFIDEAQNLIPFGLDSIQTLLAEGRSYGHSLIMATQVFDPFSTSPIDYRPLFPAWVIFREPAVSANDLTHLGVPQGSSSAVSTTVKLLPPREATSIMMNPESLKVSFDQFRTSDFLNYGDVN